MEIQTLTGTLKGNKIYLLILHYIKILKYALCSFRNKLKTTYLSGKVNRRIDFLLSILFRIEEDKYFKYQRKCQLPTGYNIKDTHHQRALDIPAQEVEVQVIVFRTTREEENRPSV